MSRQPLFVLWHSVVIFWLMAQILGKLMFRNRMKSSHQALWGFENVVTSYKHLKMSGKCSDVVLEFYFTIWLCFITFAWHFDTDTLSREGGIEIVCNHHVYCCLPNILTGVLTLIIVSLNKLALILLQSF